MAYGMPTYARERKLAVRRFFKDDNASWAASIAYYNLLSLFPLLLAIGSVAAFFVDPQWAVAQATHYLETLLPRGPVAIDHIVVQTLSTARGAGLITLLWTGSLVFGAVTKALNIVFETDEDRDPPARGFRDELHSVPQLGPEQIRPADARGAEEHLARLPAGGRRETAAAQPDPKLPRHLRRQNDRGRCERPQRHPRRRAACSISRGARSFSTTPRSVTGGLEALLDPKRGLSVPHPFYIEDKTARADVIGFLRSLEPAGRTGAPGGLIPARRRAEKRFTYICTPNPYSRRASCSPSSRSRHSPKILRET